MAGVLPLLVLIGLLLALWAGQRWLMYLPSGGEPSLPGGGFPRTDTLPVTTSDRLPLGAWFVHPAGPAAPAARVTVVVFNGNAGNRLDRAPLAAAFAQAGFATVLFDYRGYGGNPGYPTEAGLTADAEAVWRAVTARADVDPARLVYFAESLGTGVAVGLAAAHPPAALVLRSPYTSIADVAAHHYWFVPARWLVWDRFDSFARRHQVRCPTLFIAGDRDRVIPYALSTRLFDSWPEPKQLLTLPGADHNDAELVWGPAVIDAVTAFVKGSGLFSQLTRADSRP